MLAPLDHGAGIAAAHTGQLEFIALGEADGLVAGGDLDNWRLEDADGGNATGFAHLVLGQTLIVTGIRHQNVINPARDQKDNQWNVMAAARIHLQNVARSLDLVARR